MPTTPEAPAPAARGVYAQTVRLTEKLLGPQPPGANVRDLVTQPDTITIDGAPVPLLGPWSITSCGLGAVMVTAVVPTSFVRVDRTGSIPTVSIAGRRVLTPTSAVPDLESLPRDGATPVEVRFFVPDAAVIPAFPGDRPTWAVAS